jgi:hypothetical protein
MIKAFALLRLPGNNGILTLNTWSNDSQEPDEELAEMLGMIADEGIKIIEGYTEMLLPCIGAKEGPHEVQSEETEMPFEEMGTICFGIVWEKADGPYAKTSLKHALDTVATDGVREAVASSIAKWFADADMRAAELDPATL